MTPFGTTTDGKAVHALTIAAGGLSVRLLTRGAIIQSVRLAGVAHDLTLGSDDVTDYEGPMRSFGTLVGPVVNRLSGAKAHIGGVAHEFDANKDGPLTLHSGLAGTLIKIWDIVEHGADFAVLRVAMPDGEGGFPGTREVTARFEVSAPASLRLTVTATTDKLTLMNFANHSFWNLDGSAQYDGHRLRVAADRYLPTTPDFVPTGEIVDVTGTDMDLRDGRVLAAGVPAFDNNYCLSDGREALRDVVWLTGASGVEMTLATTEPGVQIYDGRASVRPGCTAYEGLAIEAQGWPNAPNHDGFPSIELAPGAVYEAVTEWRFTAPT